MKGLRFLFDPDIFLMVVLGAFALAFFMDSRAYNPTAALFPRLISVISLVLILWTIGVRVKNMVGAPNPQEKEGIGTAVTAKTLPPLLSIAIMVAYFFLIYIFGFTLVSLAYLILVPILMGYRKIAVILLVGIFWIVGFNLVFNYLLHSRVPEGLLEGFFRRLM